MNKKINIVLLMAVLILVTACSNPFQKEVVITGQPKIIDEDTKSKETNNDITNNDETIKEDNTVNEQVTNDLEITNYFSNVEQETYQELETGTSTSIKTKVTNSFVNIIDFIFYDKEIKGVKFNDLKDSTKKRILNIAGRMDNSIENKFPNYKENISTKSKNAYNKTTDKIQDALNNLSQKTEEKIGTENYNNAKENYEELKDTTKNTYNTVKEQAKSTKDKIKNWYEEKTGK